MTTLAQVFGNRARGTDLEPLGVVDIGSNSVRLVVYEGATRAAVPLFNEKVLCGLGRNVATTGELAEDAIERALAALARFRAIVRVLRVKNLRAIATAAVRDAANGKGFIQRAGDALGARIEVLSGEREAELAAQGIRMGFMDADGVAGDLGGGSLELIDVNRTKLVHATTLPLGGLRLIDMTSDRVDKAQNIIDAELAAVPWLTRGRGRPFYAVGGTWRALAKLHMERCDYPLRVMQNYTLTVREASAFAEEIRRAKKLSSLPGISEVARARREVLPFGALVLERLMRAMQPSEVVFSVFGIREGLLYSLLPEHERRKDPLLTFCADFARQRSRSVDHASELCDWTDVLFREPGPAEGPEERRLRHAACLLSDTGWRTHPDYRGEKSLNVIAHAGMSGVDHEGRIFLALSVYYRHVGPDEDKGDALSERLKSLVSKRTLKRARIIGAAVRTAHMLSIGMPGVIDETRLVYEPGKLVLVLPKAHAGLDGERLRRRFDALARQLDRRAEVRIGR